MQAVGKEKEAWTVLWEQPTEQKEADERKHDSSPSPSQVPREAEQLTSPPCTIPVRERGRLAALPVASAHGGGAVLPGDPHGSEGPLHCESQGPQNPRDTDRHTDGERGGARWRDSEGDGPTAAGA